MNLKSSRERQKQLIVQRSKIDANELADALLSGNRSALSKAITLVESNQNKYFEIGRKVLDLCLPHSENSIRIGITGVPGVGKSTFIESFGLHLIEKNKKVAVLAIDPSSKKTGGSILGDKTRMEKLSVHPNAFIRPSPSNGALGGVANATRESMLLCEAAGFDIIIIETVGVGQSETEVRQMVDFFLLLLIPGAGDELQGIKRGIMEMADAIAVNKADGDNIHKAKVAAQEYANALHLFQISPNSWTPKTLTCSAQFGEGINKIWEIILEFNALTRSNNWWGHRRKEQEKMWFDKLIESQLLYHFHSNSHIKSEILELEKKVLNKEINTFNAVQVLIQKFKNQA